MPDLLFATRSGELRVDARRSALGRSGWELEVPERFIPLPQGATLVHLPGRTPLGADRTGTPQPGGTRGALAVAAVLPPGYLRTWLPAYEEAPGAPVLPLYGYAAVGTADGRPVVAAMRSDAWAAWDPHAPARAGLGEALAQAHRSLPGNRLVAHLQTCATDYRCLTAQNLFLRRGEGAIPVSPACNAACLGCISEQWGDVPSPQTRLTFAPSSSEIAELAAWHLARSGRNFVSFGQGCEGEPLTRGTALVEATRRIRTAFPRATIHLNTNASRPRTMAALLQAGLNSVRISIFSLDDERFRAYYRPVGYGLRDLRACADLVRAAGGQLTINLLTFPGITDAPAEVEALIGFVTQHGVHQVQLRTLNVDPLWLLSRLDRPVRGMGMRRFVAMLEQRCPGLKLGNFTRPWPAPAESDRAAVAHG
ncbi:MAG TPA: radical SAM protein [Candidatus Limnocylindrales bacterium]|nr:radical SAM protein [Candidatus Limnocylindrales bacterium]